MIAPRVLVKPRWVQLLKKKRIFLGIMVPVNKDTLLIVGIIVCVLGLIFLFKELNKTKQDIDGFKNFSTQVVRHLSAPPESVPEEKVVNEEVKEEKSEE
jgi:hypothetical protein